MNKERFGRLCYALAALILCGSAGDAAAESGVIVEKMKRYEITGRTAEELFQSMTKHGPRAEHSSRAIAQTQYKTDWNATLSYVNGACRVTKADPGATITYIFPQLPPGIDPAIKQRWAKFMAGIEKHERQHGKYVRAMLRDAKKSITGLSIKGDQNCQRTHNEAKRRVDRIHEAYEAKQREFDRREHQDGANIDRLIRAFVRE